MPANALLTGVTDNPLWAPDPNRVDLADAWRSTVGTVGDYLARQQQQSRDMGLWTGGSIFEGGHPTVAGASDAAQQFGNALLMGTTAPGIRAFHGSPYSFDRFDSSKIGTGEGAQAYGHGLYFAENEGVARSYRDDITALHSQRPVTVDTGGPFGAVEMLEHDPTKTGHMYEVNIAADPEHFLDWDKPLSQQSQYVQDRLRATGLAPDATEINTAGHFGYSLNEFRTLTPEYQQKLIAQLPENHADYTGDPRGSEIYESSKRWTHKNTDSVAVAQALRDAGIPGIRYLDAGSRGAGEGSRNHVVFDANTIEILRKYGIAGLLGGGGAAAATQGNAPEQ